MHGAILAYDNAINVVYHLYAHHAVINSMTRTARALQYPSVGVEMHFVFVIQDVHVIPTLYAMYVRQCDTRICTHTRSSVRITAVSTTHNLWVHGGDHTDSYLCYL